MIEIHSISDGLSLCEDGIWRSKGNEAVSYPPDGNEACFSIEESSFWFRHRNDCITAIVDGFPPRNNETIFDVGGGNGFVAQRLVDAGFNVALVEPGEAGCFRARNRGVENVICATAGAARFKQHSLPAIGLFDVIEHIEDDAAFLSSIRGLMKDGGRLFVSVPSYSALWSGEDVSAGHFRRYTLAGISRVLRSVGFQVEFASYIFRFLPLPIFLLRTVPYRLGLSRAGRSADKISRDHAAREGMTGKVLDSLLQAEIENLREKNPMRFGGSCLVVARVA